MLTTGMSTKGQVVIPKAVRELNGWDETTEFEVDASIPGRVVLEAKRPFPRKTVREVAGMLHYSGPPLTLEQMEEAIGDEAVARFKRSSP